MTQGTSSFSPQSGQLMIGLLEGFMWLDRGLQENLKARGLPNVRRLESMVMLYAATGVRRPSELARKLGITRQSVNSAIRELEEKDLITLSPDPDDRRCKIIELSRSGLPVHMAATEIITMLTRTLEARIGAASVQALADILSTDWGTAPIVDAGGQESEPRAAS